MAGIGFSLRRLFSKKGVFNLCKAYGYSAIVTVGPMFLGIFLLAGIAFVARIGGMSDFDRQLLNVMLTYSQLVALLITAWFNMVVTRFASDMIYKGKNEKVVPSFFGCCAIEIVICIIAYGAFLLSCRMPLVQEILCLWLAVIMIVVWTEMIYMTALKDFREIVVTFAISLMFGVLLALITVILNITSLESLLLCAIIGYGILAVRQLCIILDYFPKSEGSCFSWLRYFERYPSLALSGGLIRVGLFAHIIIMYFGPLREHVEGAFYGAPEYDVPALIAFFSILITTISFVVSVEVNFYPKYSKYYGLFAENGSINDIKLASKEMIDVLERELLYLGVKQLFTTVLFVVIGPPVIATISPGFSTLSMSIYKFLCVGYGVYAVANSIMLIQLYFDDYTGALTGTLLFALISVIVTIGQVLHGDIHYYGIGFFAGAIAFYIYALVRLDWYTRRLPYFLLSRQSLIPEKEKGFLTRLSRKLDERCGLVLSLVLVITLITGCGYQQEEDIVIEENDIEETVVRENYDKAELSEGNIHDNMELYKDRDDYSVITMYLTVNEGNSADGSNHTWDEVNYYSASEYTEMNVDRYQVEGLLQIDETGNGIDKSSFGYGETAPNVSVQVRGQTSSDSREQKNYKVRIKDGKGQFRGQRTLNLNKHRSEPFHFLNKLNYDMLNAVPQLLSCRTQFVHLFVKDDTEGVEGEFKDYGLYTMVEQINKTYLKNHGLDENGHLYKVTFFEWDKYDEVMKPIDDPTFSLEDFEEYLEVKGDGDPSKLQNVIDEVQNYTIPIQSIVEEHFDMENICYWMAYNILIGNQDVGARNLFMYSPLNSEKFYMICWDMDNSFKNNFNVYHHRNDGVSWERGLSNFLGITLIKRIMQEPEYRQMLSDAVDDIYDHYVTNSIVKERVEKYSEITAPYIYENFCPDESRIPYRDDYMELVSLLPSEVDDNYNYFKESLDNPWPFYVDVPVLDEENNKLDFSWSVAYDVNEENITYSYILARDYLFEDVLEEESSITMPSASCDAPEPGIYCLRVVATNSSGKSADCFDYLSVVDYGKAYGCYCFVIENDGECRPYDPKVDGRFTYE